MPANPIKGSGDAVWGSCPLAELLFEDWFAALFVWSVVDEVEVLLLV